MVTAHVNEGDISMKDSKRGLFMQVVTALSLHIIGFNMGACVSFAGVFTEQLTSEQADIALTQSQISWVASIYPIGNILGFLLSSYANPRLGTVRVVQLCAPVVAGGWMLLGLGHSFWTMLSGRVLTGVGVGIGFGPVITHVGEIASVDVRGMLSLFLNMMISAGMLCIFLCGWLLGWRQTCLAVGIGPVVLMFAATLMLPQSARWLIVKGHSVDEARRSLHFYHGKSFDIDKEIQYIRNSLGEEHKHAASLFEVLRLLKQKQYLIPFCITLGVYLLLVFSGGFSTASFAPVVFKDVGGFSNPYIGSILVGALRVIASIMASIIIRRCERKTLMMINGVVGGVACLVSGCFFFFSDALVDYAWISLVAVLVIVFSMSLGIAPLANLLQTELLPNAIRSEVSGMVMLFQGITNFVMVYTFPLAASAIGMSGIYWFFTAMHLAMFIFAKVCVPCTRGKSIEEVQEIFAKKVTNTVSESVDKGTTEKVEMKETEHTLPSTMAPTNAGDKPSA